VNDGKRFIIIYERNGFYCYLKHLLHNPKCRELAGLDYSIILVWLRRLEEARQHFFSMCSPTHKGDEG
jgi:hypothetical protein